MQGFGERKGKGKCDDIIISKDIIKTIYKVVCI